MVDGCFDPLHQGHLLYFQEAAKLGLPVLCNVAPDTYVTRKHMSLLPEMTRMILIDNLKDITLTYLNTVSTADVLAELQPRFYVKGKEWENALPEDQVEICKKYGITIIFTDTKIDSSQRILDNLVFLRTRQAEKNDLATFEDLLHNQRETPTGEYDESYFLNNWRKGHNSYELETRRKIEGRNPSLIKEVLQPQKALDMGCGPGALVYLLYEIGVVCDGIDFSPVCKELAPIEIRDHILIDSITKTAIPENSYDTIICREVLEHLTVAQVVKVVENMCRLSSRYIYVTTRFHPRPESLLSVTDDKLTDPTHITVLNKDFLRLLFVLQGYRRRHDLEEKMDWLKKDRVLIYEKGSF